MLDEVVVFSKGGFERYHRLQKKKVVRLKGSKLRRTVCLEEWLCRRYIGWKVHCFKW